MNIIKQLFNATKVTEERTVEVTKTWSVHWQARHGAYSSDRTPTAKFFLSKQEASKFADSLREAARLLEYTEDLCIRIKES